MQHLINLEMANQGDANANVQGKLESVQCHRTSDQALADVDSHIKLESSEQKRKGGGWITIPFIFGCEASESLAGFGAHVNLVTFLTDVMHMQILKAATVINTLPTVTIVSSLIAAFVADAYLGRFTTIVLGSWINLAGLFTLTIVAWDKTLHPTACTMKNYNAGSCQKGSSLQLRVLYLALGLMAFGSGTMRPCVAPFGASQFDQTHSEEKKQLKHYFNWYYFTMMFASLLASTVIVYIQDNKGWALGFGIPAIIFFMSILIFFAGIRLYRYNPPQGSPFTRMAQVIVAAIRKRKLATPKDASKLFHNSMNTGSGGDQANESFPKLDDDLDGDKLGISGKHLAGGGQAPATVAPSRDKKFNIEADEEEKAAGLSNVEGTDENSDVIKKVSENIVSDKKNDAEEHRLEKTREPMTVGSHRGENEDSHILLRHSDQFRFFDKAAIAVGGDWTNSYEKDGTILKSTVNPWRLCSVPQVEELKCLVRLGPMWATLMPITMAMATGSSYGVKQAATMDRHLGNFVIPAASFFIFNTITVLIWLPFFNNVLVPLLKRITGKERGMTFIEKIQVGMLLLILSLAVTTFVEHKRRDAARQYGLVNKPHNTIPISAFWLVPQHVIGGLSESFMTIGHIEFFYYMLPEHLTTTGSALILTATAMGKNLSTVLLQFVQKVTKRPGHPGWLDNNLNKAHLDYFYGLQTFLIILDFVFFLAVARWYKKQRHLNQMMVEMS